MLRSAGSQGGRMFSARLKVVLGLVAVIGAGAGVGWYGRERLHHLSPSFDLWRTFSGKSHGGHRAQVGGVSLYYETYGKGPPVLVLHGGAASLETMHYQIVDLARDHLVIAVDSRGHGRSSDLPGPMHYADMAQDIIGLMDQLHIARADIVGWSDGGNLGLDMAMKHPERVGRLVTIGANFDAAGLVNPNSPVSPDNEEFADGKDIYRTLSETPDNWPVLYRQVTDMWRDEPHYTTGQLGQIHSPVLVMAGEHDAVRRSHTDALAQAIPGAQEKIFPHAGHMVLMTEPAAVDGAIRAFLASHPDRRP
jgi:pimeloyl-ACP methyl ester carboxylesterase